jgi:hypothetical protein
MSQIRAASTPDDEEDGVFLIGSLIVSDEEHSYWGG